MQELMLKKKNWRIDMKQEIKNPYKLNIKLYFLLLIIFILSLYIGIKLQIQGQCKIAADIIKNLSFGGIASTIVAMIIEIGNIREKNERFNNTYLFMYSELMFNIRKYIGCWSEICCIILGKSNLKNKKLRWIEWYELAKETLSKRDNSQYDETLKFLRTMLCMDVDYVNKSLHVILEQKAILKINDIYDTNMDKIIRNFLFEFECMKKELERISELTEFWRVLDALNKDIKNYINDWSDIKYYNYLEFKPYEFYENYEDIIFAIKKSTEKH